MAVINPSESYIEDKVQLGEKKVNTFEKDLERELAAFFLLLANDWFALYSAGFTQFSTQDYSEELESVLRRSYRKTANWFKDDLKRDIVHESATAETEEDEQYYAWLLSSRESIIPALTIYILDYINTRPVTQASLILNTTNNVIRKNIVKAMQSLDIEGIIDNAVVAKTALSDIKAENRKRATNIADNEINSTTQDIRFKEANLFGTEIARNPYVGGGTFFLEKIWKTRGDERVRTSHVIANGQRRRLNTPFIVRRQLLMYPRDMSLGADLDNVMGCRCWVTYG